MSHSLIKTTLALLLALIPTLAFASGDAERFDLTASWVGYTALAVFAIAYALVMAEEFTHLRKSKPVVLAAGIIWLVIAYYYTSHHGDYHTVENAVHHNIMEFAELFLFLLAAMTYINAMEERRVFEALRSWLIRSGYGYRKLFWMTGFLAFFISPVADNLTTALLMCAVVMSPNGLKAPPALAATTILMQAMPTNLGLSAPTASTTAHISSAVVRLSATGEMKKARKPVIQNSFR
jgi:Na+/H+ antiporter NhaD/arsenite permease-like protein